MKDEDDRNLTQSERAEIAKRKHEIQLEKKSKRVTDLQDLKKTIGIKDKGKK